MFCMLTFGHVYWFVPAHFFNSMQGLSVAHNEKVEEAPKSDTGVFEN